MRRVVQRGFTLIEVMIVVAIVAILAAVALPSYVDYLRRGQVPEAFTYLSDFRIKLEQYYQDNRNYGTGAADSACANVAGTPSWNNFVPVGRKYFDFSCALVGAGGQDYRLTATGISSTRAGGHVYTLNSAGLKRTTQLKGATVDKTCWAVKESDC